jgi:hypothetical protein
LGAPGGAGGGVTLASAASSIWRFADFLSASNFAWTASQLLVAQRGLDLLLHLVEGLALLLALGHEDQVPATGVLTDAQLARFERERDALEVGHHPSCPNLPRSPPFAPLVLSVDSASRDRELARVGDQLACKRFAVSSSFTRMWLALICGREQVGFSS